MPYRILAVDDDLESVKYHWDALEQAGMHLVHCHTVAQATSRDDLYYFDLMLIDVMMEHDDVIPTGLEVVDHIRNELGIRILPVILLTNYPGSSDVRQCDDEDALVKVLYKAKIDPMDLVKRVNEFIAEFHDPAADSHDYFALDVSSSKPVALRFYDVDPEDAPKLVKQWSSSPHFTPSKTLMETFVDWMNLESHRRAVRKLMRTDGSDTAIEGLIFLGGDSRYWQTHSVFESAPWNRYEAATDRKLKHVGKVLVARFVRESIGRAKGRITAAVSNVADGKVELFKLHIGTAEPFFSRLGFKQAADDPLIHYLPEDEAISVLNAASPTT